MFGNIKVMRIWGKNMFNCVVNNVTKLLLKISFLYAKDHVLFVPFGHVFLTHTH